MKFCILREIFGRVPEPKKTEPPDDSSLQHELSVAFEEHRVISEALVDAANKQIRQAANVREVVEGVIHRMETRNQSREKKWII